MEMLQKEFGSAVKLESRKITSKSPRLIISYRPVFERDFRSTINEALLEEVKKNNELIMPYKDHFIFYGNTNDLNRMRKDVLTNALLKFTSQYKGAVKSIDFYIPEEYDLQKYGFDFMIDADADDDLYLKYLKNPIKKISLAMFIPNIYSWISLNPMFTIMRFNFNRSSKFVFMNYQSSPMIIAKNERVAIPKFKITDAPELALSQLYYYIPSIKPSKLHKFACTVNLDKEEVIFS